MLGGDEVGGRIEDNNGGRMKETKETKLCSKSWSDNELVRNTYVAQK